LMGLELLTQEQLYEGLPATLIDPSGRLSGPELYLFTNEAHRLLFKQVVHRGKSVFGIAGGGDYLIGAIAQGAKSVLGVDFSKDACLHAELKWAAVKNLSIKEFLDFFDGNHNYLPVLEHDLSHTAREYFSKAKVGRNKIMGVNREKISYLSDVKTYSRCQEMVRNSPKPKIIHDAFQRTVPFIPTQDIIYLSNILSYTFSKLEHDYEELIAACTRKLNIGGKLIVFGHNQDICEDICDQGYTVKIMRDVLPSTTFNTAYIFTRG
jgi:hypothetical protein